MTFIRALASASFAPALFALPVLSACAIIPDAPNMEGTPRAEGMAVALMQPVRVGDIVITPRAVKEDSRCPLDTRCVWAGRLIVTTRIDGAGWRDTADIALGETYGTHGRAIALTSATPERRAAGEIAPGRYRFVYAAR